MLIAATRECLLKITIKIDRISVDFDFVNRFFFRLFLRKQNEWEMFLGDSYVKGGIFVFIILAARGGVGTSWFAIAIYPTTNFVHLIHRPPSLSSYQFLTTFIENNMDMSRGRAIELCTVASCRTIEANKINNNNIEFERKWNVRTSCIRNCTKLNTHRTMKRRKGHSTKD